MADIAQFGIEVPPVTGADEAAKKITAIGDAGDAAGKKIQQGMSTGSKAVQDFSSKSTGGFNNLTGAVTRNAGGLQMLLRTLGPLGGQATIMAAQLERGALVLERMGATAATTATQQGVLDKAFAAGQISAATMAAAQERLSAARLAAGTAENSYTSSLNASKIAQADLKNIQNAIMLQSANISQGRVAQAAAEEHALNGTFKSLGEYDVAMQKVQILTANVAAGEANLTSLRAQAQVATVNYRTATQQLAAEKQKLGQANSELASSERLVADAQSATTVGMGGTIALVGGVIAVLVALAAAFIAVKTGWDLLKSSISDGAKLEGAKTQLEQVMGSAQNAQKMLNSLEGISAASGGRFSTDQLTDTATKVRNVGNAVSDVVPLIQGFAELASRTTSGSVATIGQIYDRAIQSIADTSQIGAREMKTFTAQGVNLEQLLTQAGVKLDTVRTKTGAFKITYDQLNAAFIGAGQNLDALEKKGATFNGLVGTIKTLWEQAKASFGEPVAIALEPILRQIRDYMPQIRAFAEEAGERVANLVNTFASIANTDGWKTAIKAAWQVLMDEIGEIIKSGINAAFSGAFAATGIGNEGKNAAALFTQAYNAEYQKDLAAGETDAQARLAAGVQATWEVMKAEATNDARLTGEASIDALTNGALSKLDQDKAKLKDALAAVFQSMPEGAGSVGSELNRNYPTGADSIGGGVGNVGQNFPTPFDSHPSVDKFKTDADVMTKFWQEEAAAAAGANNEMEKNAAISKLVDETVHKLLDPGAFVSQFDRISMGWKAMEAARENADKQANERIKAGVASTSEAINSGLIKLQSEWGNWAQTVQKLTVDIGKAMSTDIATGLTDIINGTKSVSQGFRDMAVAILSDISKIIIEMLVMKSLFGTSSTGSTSTTGGLLGGLSTWLSSIGTMHTGGTVGVGSLASRPVDPSIFIGAPRFHNGLFGDEFPAILQKGEQVIPKGGSAGNIISISITNNADGTQSRSSSVKGGGTDKTQAKELARMVEATMDQWAIKNKKHGGHLQALAGR